MQRRSSKLYMLLYMLLYQGKGKVKHHFFFFLCYVFQSTQTAFAIDLCFAVLHKSRFGNSLIVWTRITYSSPSPSMRTKISSAQGLPLFPSLFAIYIEPLATYLKRKKGFRTKIMNHRIGLYADNVLLFLQNSQGSLSGV